MNRMFRLNPIGTIHSPYKAKKEAPHQGKKCVAEIEILREHEDGLKDINGFSHLHVIYWLHKSGSYSLSVNTPWDPEPRGMFATRAPNRPNPIGYSVVEIVEVSGNRLRVRGLDAIEGTPVIDIKPYIPLIDAKPQARTGWLEGKFDWKSL